MFSSFYFNHTCIVFIRYQNKSKSTTRCI